MADALARGAAFLATVVIVLIVAAMRPTGNGLPSYEDLKAMPEATLFYPGSTVLERLGQPREEHVLTGATEASTGAFLGTNDSPEAVYSWYDAQLASRGWTRDSRDTSNIRVMDEDSVAVWRKDGVIVRASTMRKDAPGSPLPRAAAAFSTVVFYELIAKPMASFAPLPRPSR